MPSKKNSKARKGAKKAEEKQGQGTPDTQMPRLKMKIDEDSQDEDALLEEAIKLAAAEKEALEAATVEKEETSKRLAQKHGNQCDHGYVKTRDHFIIEDFANTFTSGFATVGAAANLGYRFAAADRATEEKYPEVWDDPSKLKLVVSYFLGTGTQKVLAGNINNARLFASLACYFEEHIAAKLREIKATMGAVKLIELMGADEHTLVKYLRKSIPCSCLDGKYEEVKSIKKNGPLLQPAVSCAW